MSAIFMMLWQRGTDRNWASGGWHHLYSWRSPRTYCRVPGFTSVGSVPVYQLAATTTDPSEPLLLLGLAQIRPRHPGQLGPITYNSVPRDNQFGCTLCKGPASPIFSGKQWFMVVLCKLASCITVSHRNSGSKTMQRDAHWRLTSSRTALLVKAPPVLTAPCPPFLHTTTSNNTNTKY